MFFKLPLIALLLLVGVTFAAKIPNFIKKCAQKDPNLNECITKNANEALPQLYGGNKDLKIPKLVPLILPHVESNSGNLKFSIDNVTIYGLDTLKLTKSISDFEKKIAVMVMHGEHFDIDGTYDVDGRILILPIKGKGPLKLAFDDVTFTFTITFEFYEKEGKTYSKLIKSTLDWDAAKSKYQLDDLFNGDKVLGKEMNKFLNENAKDVNKDVGYVVIEALKQIVDNAFKSMIESPLDEIFA